MPEPLSSTQVDALRLAVIRLDRKLRKSAGSGGMTPSQYSALFTLDRHGPFRLGELARREQISSSSVTRLAAGLEARGWAIRAEDDSDGRSSVLSITDDGRAVLVGLAQKSNDYLRQRMAALSESELSRLLDAVDVITRLAERA